MADKSIRHSKTAWRWAVVAICIAVGVIIAGLVAINISPGKNVTSFTECKDAGGAIAESLPDQCVINGKTYMAGTNDTGTKTDTSEAGIYVGLTEDAALKKAANENRPARVVSRNGEALPMTMDFVEGRLNFMVNNEIVEQVKVEGE